MTMATGKTLLAFEVVDMEDGSFAVLLADYTVGSDDICSIVSFPTEREALSFVAANAPQTQLNETLPRRPAAVNPKRSIR